MVLPEDSSLFMAAWQPDLWRTFAFLFLDMEEEGKKGMPNPIKVFCPLQFLWTNSNSPHAMEDINCFSENTIVGFIHAKVCAFY